MGDFKRFRPLNPNEEVDRVAINDLGLSINSVHECLDQFRTESRTQRERMLTALGLDPASDLAPRHKSLLSLTRSEALWRVGAVVFAGIMAMPLIAKIVDAIWRGVMPVLLK